MCLCVGWFVITLFAESGCSVLLCHRSGVQTLTLWPPPQTKLSRLHPDPNCQWITWKTSQAGSGVIRSFFFYGFWADCFFLFFTYDDIGEKDPQPGIYKCVYHAFRFDWVTPSKGGLKYLHNTQYSWNKQKYKSTTFCWVILWNWFYIGKIWQGRDFNLNVSAPGMDPPMGQERRTPVTPSSSSRYHRRRSSGSRDERYRSGKKRGHYGHCVFIIIIITFL